MENTPEIPKMGVLDTACVGGSWQPTTGDANLTTLPGRTLGEDCWTTKAVKVTLYMVIQDILPTKERLYKIRLADSPLCRQCGSMDTVIHRVTECGEGARIWKWTKRRIAWILHTNPANILPDWTTRPQFQLWPPTRKGTVLWILAQMVWYRIKTEHAQCKTTVTF
jgi:hypothetical protein